MLGRLCTNAAVTAVRKMKKLQRLDTEMPFTSSNSVPENVARPPYLGGRSTFDFSSPQVVENLIKIRGQKQLEYVGTATSHFQAEPLLYDERGQPLVFTDWELELTRRLKGKPCGIPQADTASLPRFLHYKDSYIRRSGELSENMFRFSLDFGRLCPELGQFNEKLMEEYIQTMALIRACGQEPFITLHHFTMPRCLTAIDRKGNISAGGWENPKVSQHFRFYVQNVFRLLADRTKLRGMLAGLSIGMDETERILSDGIARYFMTINEPSAILYNGYFSGIFPPYKRASLLLAREILAKLVEAHDIALGEIKHTLREQTREPFVGIGHSWPYFEGFLGSIAQEFQDNWTSSFERNGAYSDYIGVHYYFRRKIPLSSSERSQRDFSDQPTFGDVYPRGILDVIRQAHSKYPRKELFVSEIGFSDRSDLRRPYWILETMRYIYEAASSGIPIKGVLLWSLVNNFEWDLGMSQKFGLFSEAELTRPLNASPKGIRSWEAWHAATRAIISPSTQSLRELQGCYENAYAQYKGVGGKY